MFGVVKHTFKVGQMCLMSIPITQNGFNDVNRSWY